MCGHVSIDFVISIQLHLYLHQISVSQNFKIFFIRIQLHLYLLQISVSQNFKNPCNFYMVSGKRKKKFNKWMILDWNFKIFSEASLQRKLDLFVRHQRNRVIGQVGNVKDVVKKDARIYIYSITLHMTDLYKIFFSFYIDIFKFLLRDNYYFPNVLAYYITSFLIFKKNHV